MFSSFLVLLAQVAPEPSTVDGLKTMADLWPLFFGVGTIVVLLTAGIIEGRIRISVLQRDLEVQGKEIDALREEAKIDRHDLRNAMQKILLAVQRIETKLEMSSSASGADR